MANVWGISWCVPRSSLPDLTAKPGLGTVHSWAVPQTEPLLPQDNQLYQTSTDSLLPFCLCWCPSGGAHGLGVCRNHSWMMNPSPWTARPAGCSIKCSCLDSSNCTYRAVPRFCSRLTGLLLLISSQGHCKSEFVKIMSITMVCDSSV